MTDYAADCLSHERHDSVICLIVAILLTVSEFRTIETSFSLEREKQILKNCFLILSRFPRWLIM